MTDEGAGPQQARRERFEPALGTIVFAASPELVDLLASAGLDVVCIDMMISPTTWADATNMIRAARQFGARTWIRVQGYPWDGGAPSTRTVSDVMRALSIGADAVTISVDSRAEVEAILHPLADHHRRIWLFDGRPKRAEESGAVYPLIESEGALEHLESIFQVPDLDGVYLGLSDISRILGCPGDTDNASVRRVVSDAVDLGRRHGVRVMAGIGYHTDMDSICDSAEWMWRCGVAEIWLPYPTFVLSRFYREAVGAVRSRLATG